MNNSKQNKVTPKVANEFNNQKIPPPKLPNTTNNGSIIS